MSDIQILATGKKFIGSGLRAIEPVLEELIISSEKEIHLLAYLFTTSAIKILELLESRAGRGIAILLVVNHIKSQPIEIQTWFQSASSRFPHVKIVDFGGEHDDNLHAKVIVSDRKKAVVGSANFSWGGMVANYEVAVLVEGQPAWKLAAAIDSLASC